MEHEARQHIQDPVVRSEFVRKREKKTQSEPLGLPHST